MAIKRILVPIDLSTPSVQVLDYAIGFAKPLQAELILLHVVEPLYYSGDLGLLVEEQQRIGNQELLRLGKRVTQKQLKCRTIVQRGTPYLSIIETAKKRKVDLILIGTHGRSGFSHMLLGSITDKVLRSAACPVLTVCPKHLRRRK